MTEAEWLAAPESRYPLERVERMLAHVEDHASKRKVRLAGVAFCRRLWPALRPRQRRAVETAERYADGLASSAELDASMREVVATVRESLKHLGPLIAATVALQRPDLARLAQITAAAAASDHDPDLDSPAAQAALVGEGLAQVEILRDVFGNPFHPVGIDSAWLEWNSGTVEKLARTIYEDGRWDLMPILGDALEDALCDNADILDHCRGPGPHVRGCWVVDLILGRS